MSDDFKMPLDQVVLYPLRGSRQWGGLNVDVALAEKDMYDPRVLQWRTFKNKARALKWAATLAPKPVLELDYDPLPDVSKAVTTSASWSLRP